MYVTLNHTTGGCKGVHLGQGGGGGGGGGWENRGNGTNDHPSENQAGQARQKRNAKQTPKLAPAGTESCTHYDRGVESYRFCVLR